MTAHETPHDGKLQAENILKRCNKTLNMWKEIYATLGKEFEYRDPSADEYAKAIEIQFKLLKKPPNKPKKD